MRVVVCGAGGFLGRRFIRFLLRNNHPPGNVIAITRHFLHLEECSTEFGDLRDYHIALRVCEGATMVFNFAAQVGGIGYIGKNSVDCLLSSLINTNLLRACEKHKVTRYFFASSSCVYPGGGVMTEDKALPANPGSGYGWEKIFSEQMCLAFDQEKRVPCTIARLHTLYGPGDIRPAGREHVIEALCKKIVEAKLSGRHEITIWGDGSQQRSFLFVDDAAEGAYKLACRGITGPVNLSGRESATVNQLVNMLEEIAGIKLERFYNPSAPTGKLDKRTDNSLLWSSLNWEPTTPLIDGLRRTYSDMWERGLRGELK